MNNQIRRLGIGLAVCYLALFAMLNWVQVFKAPSYNEDPRNTAEIRKDYNRPRGAITSGDGVLLAHSIANPDPTSEFKRIRVYPQGDLFGQVTGFWSFKYGATGLEKTYSDQLTGQTLSQRIRGFADMFTSNENVGNITISLRRDMQDVARNALGSRQGSVVAVDPRTGELLAFWSYPSYDPNLLSGTDFEGVDAAWSSLNSEPGQPMRPHQYQDRYFPGSTFKVVTAATGVQGGVVTVDSPSYPVERSYTPPQTNIPIFNFGGSLCGGVLYTIMEVSCNSAFARMGAETIGPQAMIDGAEGFGFNDRPPIDLPGAVASVFPTNFSRDIPKLAQSSIGQNDVQATPLQMALVAGAIANRGEIMKPHLMTEVTDSDGNVISRYQPSRWRNAVDADTAEIIRQGMIQVVQRGTATGLAIPGYEVGGKTGTAQLGTEPPRSHTWIIGFAGPPGEDPTVAVAVVVLDQPGASEFTGGAVAAPIARAVLQAVLAVQARG